ncbi:1-acyl-sn-glycerol-3-phosphate acyltransferase [Crocinitomix catalasitica]|nr:1-acyl-sn-glycerol-3-phosphate acyltransferase [Crocinitomix catalasitica]
MIYTILKILCRITIRSYFRRVKIDGKHHIPTEGPYIFVANHPSAFMDPIVIASYVRPKIYFIAAGEYIGKGVKAWFMQSALHMIPVYRPSSRPEDTHKNVDMFKSCFTHLAKGRSLLIFPEGVSKTELKLKPVKTGVSRIARGAELNNDMSLDLHIVPIGLNYSDPHRFRSDLYVKIGEAIKVTDFISKDAESEGDEIRSLTAAIENQLKKSVLHLESAQEEDLLRKIETVYAGDLKQEFEIEYEDQAAEFQMQQEMILAIEYYEKNNAVEVVALHDSLNYYFDELENLGLRSRGLRSSSKAIKVGLMLKYIFGAPIFILGFILNALPYLIVQTVNRRLKIGETFQGSLILATGLFIYLSWYIGITIGTFFVPQLGWWCLCLPIIGYSCGIFALVYLASLQRSRERKDVKRSSRFDEESVNDVRKLRKDIIDKLEVYKEEYFRQRDDVGS